MNNATRRILLTGATGFVGRQVLPLLIAQGYEVHAVSSQKRAEPSIPHGSWHHVDLLAPAQPAVLMEQVQPTHLLHIAWCPTVPGVFWTSPENLPWVQASLGLLQAFVQYGGQRVVMVGTCAEYDWDYGYCVEGVTPLHPSTLYGVCKHALQMMATAFAQQHRLSLAWGRTFFTFGPHEYPQRLIASVIRSLLRGEPAQCSHGKQIRDFLYVEDLAHAFVALLDSEVTGEINISSGEPVALYEAIFHIADTLGKRDLVRLGALPARDGDPPLLVGDTRRLREEVGWSPIYSLEQGIQQTVSWWQHQDHIEESK